MAKVAQAGMSRSGSGIVGLSMFKKKQKNVMTAQETQMSLINDSEQVRQMKRQMSKNNKAGTMRKDGFLKRPTMMSQFHESESLYIQDDDDGGGDENQSNVSGMLGHPLQIKGRKSAMPKLSSSKLKRQVTELQSMHSNPGQSKGTYGAAGAHHDGNKMHQFKNNHYDEGGEQRILFNVDDNAHEHENQHRFSVIQKQPTNVKISYGTKYVNNTLHRGSIASGSLQPNQGTLNHHTSPQPTHGRKSIVKPLQLSRLTSNLNQSPDHGAPLTLSTIGGDQTKSTIPTKRSIRSQSTLEREMKTTQENTIPYEFQETYSQHIERFDQWDEEKKKQHFDTLEDYHKNNELTYKNSQEARISHEQYNRIIVCEYIAVFFAGFGIFLAIVLNELVYNKGISFEDEQIFLYYIMASTFGLIVTLYFRYELYLRLSITRGLLIEFDNLISTGWWKDMVLEQVLALVAPYPFLTGLTYIEVNKNWNVTITYEFNQILMCLSFLRIYYILRFSLIISRFMSPSSYRVCLMNGCKSNHMFAIKSIMKQRPYTFITAALIFTIFMFGYQLKVFEGPLSEVSNQNFHLMSNAIWNVIITLTTTGYGEFYPKTNFGRFIGLIICFWGTFVVSFFVVTVNNMLTFTSSEEKSYTLLQRLHFKEELKSYAVNVLSCAYQHRIARIKEPDNKKKTIGALRQFRGSMLSFQQAVMRVRNYYEGDSEIEILMRLVENLHEQIDEMKQENASVYESLSSVVAFINRIENNQEHQNDEDDDELEEDIIDESEFNSPENANQNQSNGGGEKTNRNLNAGASRSKTIISKQVIHVKPSFIQVEDQEHNY